MDIFLTCFFCKATKFEIPYEGYTPHSGEMIKCSNCGRLNDADALIKVAENKGVELVEKQIEKELKKMFK